MTEHYTCVEELHQKYLNTNWNKLKFRNVCTAVPTFEGCDYCSIYAGNDCDCWKQGEKQSCKYCEEREITYENDYDTSVVLLGQNTKLICRFDTNKKKHKATLQCCGDYNYAIHISISSDRLFNIADEEALRGYLLKWVTWFAKENIVCDIDHALYWRNILDNINQDK